MVELEYPNLASHRGVGYWLRPANLWASRRIFRADFSDEWRRAFERRNPPFADRSKSFRSLARSPSTGKRFRFIIVADTGEGDRSQYGLVPLIRAAKPDFMIINGDVAYPAGRYDDFLRGFFEPYRGLGIPIWATAGNHEYYSRDPGRVFYDIFCTPKHRALWSRYGLRMVPQPSTLWELRDPSDSGSLVVIGLDTGLKGNLDGHNALLRRINPFIRSKKPDSVQHEWLERRLSVADSRSDKVMVLFHIPGLVKQRHEEKTRLGELHRILARHPSVRIVVCGHEHNYQRYAPDTFEGYGARHHRAVRDMHEPPHYIVMGNGGATLDGTDYKDGDYATVQPDGKFPSVDEWKAYSAVGQRLVEKAGLDKSFLARSIGALKKAKSARVDQDAAQFLCYLLVEVDGTSVQVTPVFMRSLMDLFSQLPSGTRVRVDDPRAPINSNAVDSCRQTPAIAL